MELGPIKYNVDVKEISGVLRYACYCTKNMQRGKAAPLLGLAAELVTVLADIGIVFIEGLSKMGDTIIARHEV